MGVGQVRKSVVIGIPECHELRPIRDTIGLAIAGYSMEWCANMNKKNVLPIESTALDTWFERDRAFVELKVKTTGKTIIEWWDEAVGEASEDGFLVFGKGEFALHQSAYEYAKDMDMLPTA